MQDMICALAEILSDRQLLAEQYDKKTKDTKVGIMQISPATAYWLVRYKPLHKQKRSKIRFKEFNVEDILVSVI